MSKTIEIKAETIKKALESKPTSLTGVWKILGGTGSVSGSASKRLRKAWPGIEAILLENKAETAKADGAVEPLKPMPAKKADKKPAKAVAKSKYPRHPKNPFRQGSGYGLILDIIADAGSKGIGREDLLKAYCRASGKDLTHAKYDLAVINSAREDSDKRHRSCAGSFTLLKEGDCFRVRFD